VKNKMSRGYCKPQQQHEKDGLLRVVLQQFGIFIILGFNN